MSYALQNVCTYLLMQIEIQLDMLHRVFAFQMRVRISKRTQPTDFVVLCTWYMPKRSLKTLANTLTDTYMNVQ